MDVLHFLIILFGVLLCFFGIRLRKIVQFILNFVCGMAFVYSIVLVLVMTRAITDVSDVSVIMWALLVGFGLAVISVKLYRLMITVQAALITFVLSAVLLLLAFINTSIVPAVIVIIGLILAAIVGYITWMFYQGAFIFETAIVGSIMINHMWLIENGNLDQMAVVITIIVACLGILTQSYWLRKDMSGSGVKKSGVEGNFISMSSISFPFLSMLSNKDVQKADTTSIRIYEKCLVLIPILAFGIDRVINNWFCESTGEMYSFLESTYMFRYYSRALLEGVFISCIIYFVIYYKFNVSAIYQLFYLVWWPYEAWILARAGFSNMLSSSWRIVLFTIMAYFIPWIIFVIQDLVLHSEKLKVIVMILTAIIWFPAIQNSLLYGFFNFNMDLQLFLKWLGIAGGTFVLIKIHKQQE